MASRTLVAGVLAVLLLTAGCVSAPAGVGAAQNDSSTVRTIDVSATGSASAPPDLAVVSVAVEVRADSADEARERVAENVETMRQALRDAGVSDDAIRTSSYGVFPEYDHSRDGRELVGYRAVHAFEIDADVDAAGEVIDVAVGNGATRVGGVRFTLTEETRSELREEALTEAVSNARADAETIATASGASLGVVHSASTADVRFPRPYAVTAEAKGGDGGGRTVVDPGPVEVSATVSISYQLR